MINVSKYMICIDYRILAFFRSPAADKIKYLDRRTYVLRDLNYYLYCNVHQGSFITHRQYFFIIFMLRNLLTMILKDLQTIAFAKMKKKTIIKADTMNKLHYDNDILILIKLRN